MGELSICRLGEAPPRFQNVRAESPHSLGPAFLPHRPAFRYNASCNAEEEPSV